MDESPGEPVDSVREQQRTSIYCSRTLSLHQHMRSICQSSSECQAHHATCNGRGQTSRRERWEVHLARLCSQLAACRSALVSSHPWSARCHTPWCRRECSWRRVTRERRKSESDNRAERRRASDQSVCVSAALLPSQHAAFPLVDSLTACCHWVRRAFKLRRRRNERAREKRSSGEARQSKQTKQQQLQASSNAPPLQLAIELPSYMYSIQPTPNHITPTHPFQSPLNQCRHLIEISRDESQQTNRAVEAFAQA